MLASLNGELPLSFYFYWLNVVQVCFTQPQFLIKDIIYRPMHIYFLSYTVYIYIYIAKPRPYATISCLANRIYTSNSLYRYCILYVYTLVPKRASYSSLKRIVNEPRQHVGRDYTQRSCRSTTASAAFGISQHTAPATFLYILYIFFKLFSLLLLFFFRFRLL